VGVTQHDGIIVLEELINVQPVTELYSFYENLTIITVFRRELLWFLP
jgi:hypothetical protein